MLMASHTCEQCAAPFERDALKPARFCSLACTHASQRTPLARHTCEQCSTPFERAARKPGRFCSIACTNESRRVPLVQHTCEKCTGTFSRPRSTPTRFCSVVCANTARLPKVYSCERCGKSPLGPGVKRFCSRACHRETYRKITRPCPRCGNDVTRRGAKFCSSACFAASELRLQPISCGSCGQVFLPPKSRTRFCSIECVGKAKRIPLPACLHCGTTVPRPNRTYCSRSCATASRAVVCTKDCAACGKRLSNNRLTYCSQVCAGTVRAVTYPPCKVCGAQIARKNRTYCSNACVRADRVTLRPCVVCSGPITHGPNKTCSPECLAQLSRRTLNPAYTPEKMAAIRQLIGDGLSRREAAQHVGLTYGQVAGIVERAGIKAPPRQPKVVEPRAPKPARQVKPAKPVVVRSGYAAPKPRPVVQKVSAGPRPITLTDLYRLGTRLHAEDQIKRDGIHDVDAISRAVRREKPDHPGYRVVSPQYFARNAA